MARFPIREAEIKALAQSIIAGLTNNPNFPNPPVTPAELQALLDTFSNLGDTQVADQAKAQQSTEAKQNGQENLTVAMRSALRRKHGGQPASYRNGGWDRQNKAAAILAQSRCSPHESMSERLRQGLQEAVDFAEEGRRQ